LKIRENNVLGIVSRLPFYKKSNVKNKIWLKKNTLKSMNG
jgi:hypothetical protein